MTLFPISPVDGDRLVSHPNGRVLLRISPLVSVAFPDEAALDALLEQIDRERAPGRDPWRTEEYHARMQELRAERLRVVGE